jgi:poly(A) polymerase
LAWAVSALLRGPLGAVLYLGGDRAHIARFGRTGGAVILQDDWVRHPGTQALCAALGLSGYNSFFVGGCVRNSLLGAPVSDIDIATDALPEIVSDIAETAGFRVILTGIDHGTVTVIADGLHHEVTTFRRDVETDGRRAVVAFTTDVAQDAARRDFTMNALYARPSGEVIDPIGGIDDLRARRVRFVGDPHQRIVEDYLRILRFFRFHAVYGDPFLGIDPNGLAACADLSAGLATLSRERIGAEVRKLLAAPNPAPAVASMAQSGVLAQVIPGASYVSLAPLVHLEDGAMPRWQRRLAVLGGSMENLRLSRQETTEYGRIRDEIASMTAPAALGWLMGEVPAQDVVLCRAALAESQLPLDWHGEIRRGAQSVFPVSAADLMPGLQGLALGARLKWLQAHWLRTGLVLDRQALLASVDD